MKIYLAGHVPKGDEEERDFDNWRLRYQEVLERFFDAEFIDPFDRELDESDFLLVVGQDCKHIKESELVIVNAEIRLGAGTSQEMLVAKYFNKPVVTVLPKNSHHRRSNISFGGRMIEDWIHPFIFTFSDFIIEDVNEVKEIKGNIFAETKDISIIDSAIEYANSK